MGVQRSTGSKLLVKDKISIFIFFFEKSTMSLKILFFWNFRDIVIKRRLIKFKVNNLNDYHTNYVFSEHRFQFPYLHSVSCLPCKMGENGLWILQIWVIQNNLFWGRVIQSIFFTHCLTQRSVGTNVKKTTFQENNFLPWFQDSFYTIRGKCHLLLNSCCQMFLPMR